MRGLLRFLMSIHIYVYDEPMNELLPSTYGQAKRSNVLPVRYQNYPKQKKKHLPSLPTVLQHLLLLPPEQNATRPTILSVGSLHRHYVAYTLP